MKRMVKLRYIVYFICYVAIAAVIIHDIREDEMKQKSKVKSHMVTDTWNRMFNFAGEIQSLANLTRKEIPEDIKEIIQFFKEFDDGFLLERLNRSAHQDLTKGYYDSWGTPIKLEIKSSKEYTFISAGPNRKFEDGKGDDITYSFNPYEYVEEKEKSK